MSTISRSPENLFLRLCFIASRRNCDGHYYDSELAAESSYSHLDQAFRDEHLRAFLTWIALPRPEQVDDMLPYLRTLSGIEETEITLHKLGQYCETLIPQAAPLEAKALFRDILTGVFMIYLSKG
jgi:hypothetical protein